MKRFRVRSVLRAIGHQRYLRFGVRDRIIRLFDDPDVVTSDEFVCKFFGGEYRGDLASFIDWSVFYYGAYAYEELELMADVLSSRNKPVVLDIGANVGHHTLFAALQGAQVYAFEPFPELAEKWSSGFLETVLKA